MNFHKMFDLVLEVENFQHSKIFQIFQFVWTEYLIWIKRQVERRIKENRLGSGTEKYKYALFKHTRSIGHLIDYNNPVIIDKASNDNKLLLKEMLHINT